MPSMTYTLCRGDEAFPLTVEYTVHPARPGKRDGPCGPLLEPPEEALIEIGSVMHDGFEVELEEGEDQEIADAVAYHVQELAMGRYDQEPPEGYYDEAYP